MSGEALGPKRSRPLTFSATAHAAILKDLLANNGFSARAGANRRKNFVVSVAMDQPQERRERQRTRVLRNAKIIVPRGSSMIHCTVQDITGGGACLRVASTSGMPVTFELTFEHGRTRRFCRVIWHTRDRLGVAFEEPPGDD